MSHMNRRRFIGTLIAAPALVAASGPSFAAPRAFDEKAFREAQAAGKPVLVDIYASW